MGGAASGSLVIATVGFALGMVEHASLLNLIRQNLTLMRPERAQGMFLMSEVPLCSFWVFNFTTATVGFVLNIAAMLQVPLPSMLGTV